MGDKIALETNGDRVIEALRRDICPDCRTPGLRAGSRGGAAQNLSCDACGAGFNVVLPRHVMFAERIATQ